jgi:hypothetical protein
VTVKDSRWQIAAALALAIGGCAAPQGSPGGHAAGDMRLVPDPAFVGTEIAAVFSDRTIDPERCRFEWSCDGFVIPGATGPRLEPGSFRKNKEVKLTAIVTGDSLTPERRFTAAVQVANTAPSITRVTILPSSASGQAQVLATPEVIDADGDPVTFRYKWFRNGSPLPDTGPAIPIAAVSQGDHITVEATANDGTSDSAPVRSNDLPIDNRPPRFTSQPAAPGMKDDVFTYQAVAVDDEGDALRYELVSGPAGMNMSDSGTLRWTLPTGSDRKGEFPVTIRVVDPRGGEARQQFMVRLSVPTATTASTH